MKRDWSPVAAPDVEDGLVVFDGICVLCSGWVDFVIKRDPAARFRFLPMQSPRGREIAARFDIDASAPQTVVVVKHGNAFFKFDTIVAVLEELSVWRWIRLARCLPRGLRDFVYDRIAANRHAIFGQRASCRVPNADDMRHMSPVNKSGV